MLRIDSNASTGNHGKYMKYVSFPWRRVMAARDCKRLVQALHSSGIIGSKKTSLYPGFSYIHQILPFIQTVQKMISDQNCVCYDNQ
jgi:hypothetical protein